MAKISSTEAQNNWAVMRAFFEETKLVHQHLDSYNDFVGKKLQRIVDEVGKIEPDIQNRTASRQVSQFYLRLGKITIESPSIREADGSKKPIYPNEARVRDLTYSAPLFLEMIPVDVDRKTGIEEQLEPVNIYVGELPVMLKSQVCLLAGLTDDQLVSQGEDPNDPGGYFVINGSERVLVTQEDLAPNRVLVEEARRSSTSTHIAKVFSTNRGFRAPVSLERRKDGSLGVTFPSVPGRIPYAILLRALGVITDREITVMISEDSLIQRELIPTLEAAAPIYDYKNKTESQENALDYIGKRVAVGQTREYRIDRARQVLDKYLLPHIGRTKDERRKKAFFLTQMAQRLLQLIVGQRENDDKDHYSNKRLKLAGDLLTSLFRVAFLNLCRDIKYQLERAATRGRKPNIRTAVRADVITERLRHALATGNWVGGKAGVSQLLDRTNFISSLSHLRRVVSPLSRSQPHFEARDLHPTHYSKICPSETPEGPNCVLPETRITVAGGSNYPIRDMGEQDRWRYIQPITTTWHDPEQPHRNMLPSMVARFIQNSGNGKPFKLYHIKSSTGRNITVTSDHPFFTSQGKLEARFLKPGMKVAVLPAALERPNWEPLSKSKEIMLTEDDIRAVAHPSSKIDQHVKLLRALSLIPLYKNDPRYPILLRLLGFCFGDGYLSPRSLTKSSTKKRKSTVVFTGQIEDLKDIKKDLAILGFRSSPIKTTKAVSHLPDRIIEGYTSQTRCYQQPFWLLMRAMGAPAGDKQTQEFRIPMWLKQASKPEIREFLAAFFGSELLKPIIDKRNEKVFLPPILKMSKEESKAESLWRFLQDIKEMTEQFGITFPPKVFVPKEPFVRKDGTKTQKIQLCFSGSVDNLLKLWGSIGYIYNRERESLAQRAYAYLTRHHQSRSKRRSAAQYVIDHHQEIDGTPTEKARILLKTLKKKGYAEHIRLHDLVNWIKTNANPDLVRVSAHDTLSFGHWLAIYSDGLEGDAGLVWETLEETMMSISDPFEVVEDLTIFNENHNIINNGFICLNCGLVKNLALAAYISVGTDESTVEGKLYGLKMVALEEGNKLPENKRAQVFLNGRLTGFHANPVQLVKDLRAQRRRNEINPEVNIAYYDVYREIQINTDAGRVRRPAIVVENGKSKLKNDHILKLVNSEWTFNNLVERGIIDYLDAEEEENAFIAMPGDELEKGHTHLEIDPSTILGICASLIPYPEHNQSPRNTYEAGMAKQALGLPVANYRLRMDTRGHLLHYPQRPVVKTKPMDIIGFNQRPAGQNFIVGVLSFQGYNIEDALIINKSSLARGLGRSTFFRNYHAEERRYPGGQEDKFEIPDKSVRGYRAAEFYRHLGEDGIIEPEITVQGGEVLIGRTSPPRFLEEYREFDMTTQIRRETSVNLRHGEDGVVDTVVLTETVDGNRLVKIKVRDQRVPELGDKFASRHGQKGILGLLVPQEDMPFTADGVVPDLIINPHAIPSRMTLGQTFESAAGKAGAMKGEFMDGTAFYGATLDEIQNLLKESGFKYNGREVMYNGMTGEKYNVDIFIGVVYYQKLHHLVKDKMHARARGPVQILTRQPTEGRAREGGLRFGEMERDCLIGHGAAVLLKERLLEESDKSNVLICEDCGLLAVYDRNRDRYYCSICGDKAKISKVVMSYAFKLLLQELMSLGISPRLELKTKA